MSIRWPVWRLWAVPTAGIPAIALAILLDPQGASAHPGHGAVHRVAALASCESMGLVTTTADGHCSHGPDAFPEEGASAPLGPYAFGAAEESDKAICDGDGASGKRVQVMYVRQASTPDGYAAQVGNIRHYAHQADLLFQRAAAELGNDRYIRFVHDGSCTISVMNIVIPDLANPLPPNAGPVFQALLDLGYNHDSRKYLAYFDKPDGQAFCGEANVVYNNDDPTSANPADTLYGHAVIGEGCWNSPRTGAHELLHTMGAVQSSAPHATGFGHSREFRDVMGSVDSAGQENVLNCSDEADFDKIDCNKDDYFNTNPAPGSYLATRWNTANSSFLGTRTRITLDKVSSKYNGWVTATLVYFGPNSSIGLLFDGLPLTTVVADANGTASIRFRTPLTTFGAHSVQASDTTGNSAGTTLRVIPRIMLNINSGLAGSSVRFYLYGFSPGEQVEVRFYNLSGTAYQVLGRISIASNGRGSKVFTIPATAPVGNHKVVGRVVGVSRSASDTFKVTGPAPASDPTVTPTSTATASATPVATGTPSATATPQPSTTPTIEPTATVPPVTETTTPEPSPTATEPVLAPTETPNADVPTGTRVVTDTPEPAPADVPPAMSVPDRVLVRRGGGLVG